MLSPAPLIPLRADQHLGKQLQHLAQQINPVLLKPLANLTSDHLWQDYPPESRILI
jgi:hypothetical protein